MFSCFIVGWYVMTTRPVGLVTVPLRMARWQRRRHGYVINDGELLHHSDAGSQYLAFRFSEELILEGILASLGSVGGASDNALAESTIGLFKTQAMAKNDAFHVGPFKTIADVEYATVHWKGRLVQRPQTPHLNRGHPPSRIRSQLLRYNPDTPTDVVTHMKPAQKPNGSL